MARKSMHAGWAITATLVAAAFSLTPPTLSASAEDAGPPGWAYPLNPNGKPKPQVDDGALRHVPASDVALPLSAIRTLFGAPDWHPQEHPPMPDVVAHGRKPEVMACGACHLPNGRGRPENAALAGLSADYIARQVAAFADGSRRAAQPAMIAPGGMIETATHANAADVAAAAAYFASLAYRPWVRVVETDTVPKTQVVTISALSPVPGGGTEPIGHRIVEVPENEALTALRDDAFGFVAYVPPGSVAEGEALAHATQGTRQPCGTCHGEDLRGGPTAPPLAGRSPSAIFRALYDIRAGSRADAGVAPMKPEVAAMSDDDMLAVSAYVAGLNP